MVTPVAGIPLLPGRLVLMLLLLSASGAGLVQVCPGPLASTSGCSCAVDRPKAHGAQSVGRRVSCSKEELLELPDFSLFPNRTVTLKFLYTRLVFCGRFTRRKQSRTPFFVTLHENSGFWKVLFFLMHSASSLNASVPSAARDISSRCGMLGSLVDVRVIPDILQSAQSLQTLSQVG
ncbi:hypothetical protein XENOCAPTIV_022491 [Xenoophorus captivus]|uniref:Uncharacterized protein n=1 Tax=Xenoophorus captivus TaxID=1517983 RepID=A0ABV0RJH0_9TELE